MLCHKQGDWYCTCIIDSNNVQDYVELNYDTNIHNKLHLQLSMAAHQTISDRHAGKVGGQYWDFWSAHCP